MPFKDAKRGLSYLWAVWIQVYDVFFQKLSMWRLGGLETVGGSAKELTVIVTGPTSGIGLETARELARRGAHVILACRSAERGEKLRQELLAAAPEDSPLRSAAPRRRSSLRSFPSFAPRVEVWVLDLTSMASVRAFAERWEQQQRPLQVLINNAGIYSMAMPRQQTADGYESHLAANYLGHYLLTLLLMPALRRGAAALPTFGARIVSVSSAMHWLCTEGMTVADPHLARPHAFHSQIAYSQSKLAQILFTRELRHRLPTNVSAMALHPGCVLTDVVRTLPAWVISAYNFIMRRLLLTSKQGARASVYCATSPSAPAEAFISNGYFYSNCRPLQPSKMASSPAQSSWLWRWSAQAAHLPQKYELPLPS